MLENIRERSQGVVARTILGFIILTFAIAGIGSYTNSVDTSVAEINGQKISQQDFDKAYQAQRNRMAQQFGEMFETLSADSGYMANFRKGVLDNLISETLMDQNSAAMGIRVSDERLKKTIREMPEFHTEGRFDNNRYLAVINQAGFFQAADFRDYLRVEMTRRQLSQSLVTTEFNLPYQEALQTALQSQQRDIRFATIVAAQFKDGIEVSEEEISQYYQANQVQFQNEEQVKVDYLALNVNDIAKDIEVTEVDIETYYNQNIDSFRQEERRRVAHILIELGDDESASKAKAEDALARLNAGEDFAALAEELSDDTFSGENGGDLDFLERGVMEEVFEESAFALENVNDTTGIVETSFGFHIIKLTALEAEVTQPLSEIKDDLFIRVSTERAQDKFFELQQEMARLSFEFPDSLEDAAGAINATVVTSDWIGRFGNSAPFNEQKVTEAVFSDLVLLEELNSDIIEVSDELAIVLRLNEHQKATIKPLSEVEAAIRETLAANKTTERAQTVAADLLAKFEANEDIVAELAEIGSTFEVKTGLSRSAAGIDAAIAKKAFVLPHPSEGAKSASMVTLANGDLSILEVQAVNAIEVPATDPQLSQQQTSQLAQSAYQGYIESLRADAEITQKAINEIQTQN